MAWGVELIGEGCWVEVVDDVQVHGVLLQERSFYLGQQIEVLRRRMVSNWGVVGWRR